MKRSIMLLAAVLCLMLSACMKTALESSTVPAGGTESETDRPAEPEQNETVSAEPEPEAPLPEEERKPEEILLDVPQAVQENGYYCGPAVLQMILSWHGIYRDQDDLASLLNTSPVSGTEYADMARVLNTYLFDCEIPDAHAPGYRVQELTPGHISDEDLQLLCERTVTDMSTGDPVPIAVSLSSLYPEFSDANHFVLIVGFRKNDDGEITDFYVRDPYGKVQDAQWQGLKVFPVSRIREALSRNDEPAYIW